MLMAKSRHKKTENGRRYFNALTGGRRRATEFELVLSHSADRALCCAVSPLDAVSTRGRTDR